MSRRRHRRAVARRRVESNDGTVSNDAAGLDLFPHHLFAANPLRAPAVSTSFGSVQSEASASNDGGDAEVNYTHASLSPSQSATATATPLEPEVEPSQAEFESTTATATVAEEQPGPTPEEAAAFGGAGTTPTLPEPIDSTPTTPTAVLSEETGEETRRSDHLSLSSAASATTEPTSVSPAAVFSHPCAESDAALDTDTNRRGIAERMIRFDYDLLLATTLANVTARTGPTRGESLPSLDAILRQLEEQLLDRARSALEGDGLCDGLRSGRWSGLRHHRSLATTPRKDGDDGVVLGEISSLPPDVINTSASCSAPSLAEEAEMRMSVDPNEATALVCYPIVGYMTATYATVRATDDNASTARQTTNATDTDLEKKIFDAIQRGMEPNTFATVLDAAAGTTKVVGAYFVADRRSAASSPRHDTAETVASTGDNDGGVSGRTHFLSRSASSPSPRPAQGRTTTAVVAGAALAGLMVLALALYFAWHTKRRRAIVDHDDDENNRSKDSAEDHCVAIDKGSMTTETDMMPAVSDANQQQWSKRLCCVNCYNTANAATMSHAAAQTILECEDVQEDEEYGCCR